MLFRAPVVGLLLLVPASHIAAQAHWTRLYPSNAPPPRSESAMAFDSVRGVVVMFAGNHPQGGALEDQWSFDGSTWVEVTAPRPPARTGHAMVFDETRGVVVLFGGSWGQLLQDTWEWNGTTWALRLSASPPPARRAHAMAFDPQRGRTVLFGGLASSTPFGDTHEWDGQDWHRHTPPVSPAARGSAAMAFDPSLGGVLLFGGGASGQPPMDETWRWDGTDWQRLQPPNLPAPRGGGSMAADVRRQRVVLFGGFVNGGIDPYAWEWDGATWEQRFVSSPAPRTWTAMAYDSIRRQVVLFSGANSTNDTWVHRTDRLADFAPLGDGCGGSLGVPELTGVGFELPWIGDTFHSMVTPLPAQAPAFFATGLVAAPPVPLDPFGFLGCTLSVRVLATDLRLADTMGTATWSVAIPNAPGLAGARLAQQVFALDAAGPAGVSVSTARTLTIGIR